MCGVFGITSATPLSEKLINSFYQLGSSLSHRGPDGEFKKKTTNYATGFTRLAIVDITNGMQPFYTEDKSIEVTANGEIYNFQELRKELIVSGHLLNSSSDIEVIPHLYEIYGDSFVEKLRGMFAIALIDKKNCQLKLYVDKMGQKPIYWTIGSNYFAYSSELVPLLKSKLAKMELDPYQVPSYLKYGFTIDPFTLVNNTYRISGGSYVTVSLIDNSVSQTKYWSFLTHNKSISNPVSRIQDNLQEIMGTICQGEVEMSVALSGGIDSYTVASLLTQISTKNLSSITVGYEEKSSHDETKAAKKIADSLQLPNSSIYISKKWAGVALKKVCAIIDEPIADIASINYLAIFEFANSQNIKVVITGHGGDEIFFGYPWLGIALQRAEVRACTLLGKFQLKNYLKILENPLRIKSGIQNYINGFRLNYSIILQIFLDLFDYLRKIEKIDLYDLYPHTRSKSKFAESYSKMYKMDSEYSRVFSIHSLTDKVNFARYQQVKDYLRVNGFLQIDKISMANSVEARNPLSDELLLETSIDANWDVIKLNSKELLRVGTHNLNQIRHESYIKRGFTPPTRHWHREFQKIYKGELKDPRIIQIGLIPKQWRRIMKYPLDILRFRRQRWFQLLFLELWVREVESKTEQKFTVAQIR